MFRLSNKQDVSNHLMEYQNLSCTLIENVTITPDIVAKLSGTTLQRCRFPTGLAFDESLEECAFIECTMHDLAFSDCDLFGTQFVQCDLSGSRFLACNLSAAQFLDCRLDRWAFQSCDMESVVLRPQAPLAA